MRKVFSTYERMQVDWRRPHLGASEIGGPCARALWFTFRWATARRKAGRMLRLLERGKREELWLASDLRSAGLELYTVDPTTRAQVRVSFHGGHFGGSMDGIVRRVPQAPEAWHVFEAKTTNAKDFKELLKHGVAKAKPEHWAQVQVYMHGLAELGIDRALYLSVCKDDDYVYEERVRYDAAAAAWFVERARRAVFDASPPPKISDDPDWFQCRFCPHHRTCQDDAVAEVNCRTCLSSTAMPDGTWRCEHLGRVLNVAEQKAACEAHLFHPALVPWEQIDAGERFVEYRRADGEVIRNGQGGVSSRDLHQWTSNKTSNTEETVGSTTTHAR